MLAWDNPSTWRVVVIDDEPDNLELMVESLRFMGATVEFTNQPLDGYSLLQKTEPNLIILDLSMPEMDGWTLLRIIKNDLSLQDVPVLALTAHAMAGDKERAIEAGFDGYLSKPVNVPTLIQDLMQAFHKRS
jgi:CheY-like chemotaxis protein